MKKLLFILSIILLYINGFGQSRSITPGTVPRANQFIVPEDGNLSARNSLLVPRFSDTTQANAYTLIDTLGRIIYTYDVQSFWGRQYSGGGKKWVALGSGGGGSASWGSITGTLSNQTDLQTALNLKQNTITFGTNVQTALGVNIGSAGAPVLFNGAGGTPSSLTGTNIIGTASALNIGGNAATATILATGRTIAITGDLVWTSPSFNGSGSVTAAGTLATVNGNVGTFGSSVSIPTITVNAKGLITAASGNSITIPVIYTTITYAQLQTAIAGSTLNPGETYKITDRGDRGLFFKAIAVNQLARTGQRLMLCPADYAAETDGSGNTWIGVWNITKSASAGNLTIWGGLVWTNLTGVIGTSVDDITLDAVNWAVVAKASFTNNKYTQLQFGVTYDITNDWIERQFDGSGNVVGVDFATATDLGVAYNYCDVTDWNFATSSLRFYGNVAFGVFNNSPQNEGIYANTVLAGGVSGNSNQDGVFRNYILRKIETNSNVGAINDNFSFRIESNSNNGNIADNFVPNNIKDNTNDGAIFGNNVNGSINLNSNSGAITNVVSNSSVTSNIGVGDITGAIFSGNILPFTDDASSLGSTTNEFSDLFLASGGVINYANGNVVLTHTSGILTMGTGEMRITTVGANSASVVTVGGTQTLTNKTISGSSNTISNIGNSSLTNSSITIGSTSVSLGSTAATVAGLTLTAPVFTAQASPTYVQGKLTYDTDNQSLTFYNNEADISLQIGQENWLMVRNVSGSTITNGSAVYINGSNTGLPTIALSQGNSATTSVAVGLATHDIENNTVGYVTTSGIVHGLNTSGFTAGDILYVSTATPGALQNTVAAAPNYRTRIGTVGVSNASTGTILVNNPTNGLGFGTANQLMGMNNAGTGQEYKTVSTSTTAVSNDIGVTLSGANALVINIPTSSNTVRGALSTADWTTFNAKAPTASPTFTGTVTIPTPFTLGATSVTTTGTQINYLNAATGTTGTTSSSVVFSAGPTFTGTLAAAIVTASGFSNFTAGFSTNGTAGNSNFYVSGGITANRVTTATYLMAGISGVGFRAGINGTTTFAETANDAYASLAIAATPVTEPGSGALLLVSGIYLRAPTVTNAGGTTTDMATLVIEGVSTGVTPTGNTYVQWNKAGLSRFGGGILLDAGTATALTAPLKFTTGTNLTVIENGTIEYDGTNFYGSAGGTRQNIIKGVSGSFSGVGTATTTFTVTFGGTQPNATYEVSVTPTAALSAALFYVNNKTTTTFDVVYLAGLTGTVTFDYFLSQ